jgi:hypothetical protein
VELQSVIKSSLKISEDTLDQGRMRLARNMHVEANLLYNISDVWPGECEILKSTSKTAIASRIRDRWTVRGHFSTSINWSSTPLAISHPCSLKNLNHVLALREKEPAIV